MNKREKIGKLFQNAKHPWHALWLWGKHGKGYMRWKALQNWAGDRMRSGHRTKKQREAFAKAHDEYMQRKVHWLKTHKDPKPPKGDIVEFDGKQCAGWMVRQVFIPARRDGVHFVVISGVRSPEYSKQICIDKCGAPTCPGTCAGIYSNHACPPSAKCVEHEGAADIYPGAAELERYCREKALPLHGGGTVLRADPNHFSFTGR